MPDVISNTSPLQYLHQAGLLDLLPQLAESVIVPSAVVEELRQGRLAGINLPTPEVLPWVVVKSPTAVPHIKSISELGRGEAEVLALCLERTNHTAILDDNQARNAAKEMGLNYTGTLGILISAKKSGLIQNISPILDTLNRLGFRVSAKTRNAVLARANEI